MSLIWLMLIKYCLIFLMYLLLFLLLIPIYNYTLTSFEKNVNVYFPLKQIKLSVFLIVILINLFASMLLYSMQRQVVGSSFFLLKF